MQNNTNKHDAATNKSIHQHVAGKNEAQTKQQTKPLAPYDSSQEDEEEGDMNNGEIGAGLKKDE